MFKKLMRKGGVANGWMTHHESGNVLQEQERDTALSAEFDKVRTLLRRLGEEHTVVRDDTHGNTVDARKACDTLTLKANSARM